MIDLIDMKAYRYDGDGRENCTEIPIPDELADRAQEMREKLMDEVAEVSDELMERYLEGEEISHEETVTALKTGVTEGHLFPVTCGAATRNLGINRLLDAFVEDLPSPAKRGTIDLDGVTLEPDEAKETVAFVFKTLADPYAGRAEPVPRLPGRAQARLARAQLPRRTSRSGSASCWCRRARTASTPTSSAPATSAPSPSSRRRTPATCWPPTDAEIPLALPRMPRPVMAFAIEAKAKGDEEKMGQALRRLQEEDPTIDFHRDEQTGEQILAGITQIHVEVIVDRMKERFGAEVELHQPHVPYREAIKGSAKAHARYKKQTGGRGQFADCHIEIEPLAHGEGFEFVNAIKGGVIPGGFIPAVEKGVREAMRAGVVAGFPVQDVRVRLFDGQHHSVDSSEMAFKIAGSMAFKDAMENAQAVLMEPIMTVTVTVPEAGRRRRDRRPQLAARPAARHGAQGQRDRGQGRGPDGGAAQLRARPARHHRRAGRVHDGAGPLRGDPGAHRAIRRAGGRPRAGGGQGLIEAALSSGR